MLDEAAGNTAEKGAAKPRDASSSHDDDPGVARLRDIEQVAPRHPALSADQQRLGFTPASAARRPLIEDLAGAVLDLALGLREPARPGVAAAEAAPAGGGSQTWTRTVRPSTSSAATEIARCASVDPS